MDTDKTKVKPGETVNAHIEIEGAAPYPKSGKWKYGESDITAVLFELNVDPKLTVKSVDKLDFKWSDGKKRELTQAPTVDEEHNTIAFEFATGELRPGFKSTTPFGADTSLSVDIPVTVNETVKAGEELGVTVGAEIDIRPTLDWTYGKWEMNEVNGREVDNAACYRDAEGTLTFENPGRYGTWMADLWLGTTADHFRLNGQPEFTVTGPNGEDLTNKVFPTDDYPKRTLNPQAKPTIYTGADGTDLTNYRWLSRYEWKFNEKKSAGDVWIPEDSTIHVKQRVRSTGCSFDPSKDHFGVKVESRNAHLFEQDVARAALTVDENPEAPTPSETEPKPDTEKESEPSSTSSTPSTEATTTSDSPEPSEPTEPTEPSEPSEPSETTPNEDGETTVTTTEPETEDPEPEPEGSEPKPEPEEDPEPSSPSSTTSTEVTTTSETPASSTTETTTKTTTPTCKPSESESPKPSDPSEPSEPTPSESGKTTVPSTEPESEDPDCEPSGSPEPTPSSTTTPTLPQPLLPVPLLSLGKNKDKEPSTTPDKPKSSEPQGTEPREPGKQQETTQPQNGSQSHAATSTTAPAPAKGDHSQRTTGLANTGASVIGLVIAGIMAIAGGLFLVRRNRNA
ncbi:LPXTG cell wall anchor domain-containing protein [Corynebacterium accolens]|uniref:LPXTG cell wall anchor domain-containing protein n=1 Tax=Corynebacterium accolens TaxID=38284 RepID=UPI002543ECEA|nr:LPXTG cell wall anchor domain-containing protein [Corynebacterium accolens]MDK4309940.1 LPXTG cell wall anchor domain-containing protein [Corynebacterium accolens]